MVLISLILTVSLYGSVWSYTSGTTCTCLLFCAAVLLVYVNEETAVQGASKSLIVVGINMSHSDTCRRPARHEG